jgi:hypothetical protein
MAFFSFILGKSCGLVHEYESKPKMFGDGRKAASDPG